MQYSVKGFIDLGYSFEKWMLEAVRVANTPENTDSLATIAYRVKEMPQFRSHTMRDTACPIYQEPRRGPTPS